MNNTKTGTGIGSVPGSHCGPYAVAVLANKSLDQVKRYFRRAYDKSPGWGGRANVTECVGALRHYKRNPTPAHVGYISVAKFVDTFTTSKSRYFIRVGNHFMAIIGKTVYDQHAQTSVDEHWARNKRISHVYEL